MVYVIYCQLTPGLKLDGLEKAIAEAGPSRKMTANLWLFEARAVPGQLENVLKSLQVKSFIAPLHPNGPSGGKLAASDKAKRKTLHIIHCQLLREPEKERLEKIIHDSGACLKFTEDFWFIAADAIPENLETFLKSLHVMSFAAPLHPDAQCGGHLLAAEAEWLVQHSSKNLQ